MKTLSIVLSAVFSLPLLVFGQIDRTPIQPNIPKGVSTTIGSPGTASGASSVAGAPPQNGIQYHGGPLMLGPINIYYIWYGNWSGNGGTLATNVLENLASQIGGSPYFNINTTYSDSTGASVANIVRFAGSTTDSYSQGTALTDNSVQTIVSSAITSGRLPSDTTGVYFVLASADVNETSGFCTQYCGWHTWATIQGANIKFAFIGDADRCPSACAAQSNSPNGEAGVDGMASIISHELEESATDPNLNAWYDTSNNENADKCAWTFGTEFTAPNGSKANITLGGYNYLIQRNWVNASGGYCAMSYAAPTAPTLTSINPSTGSTGSSVPVTLTGTNFIAGPTIGVGGSGVTASNVVVASSTQITATFTIAAGAGLGTHNVSVTTSAGTTAPVAFTVSSSVPVVTLLPASLSFPSQMVNTTSSTQPVTITNTGPGTLTISSISFAGTNAGDFGQTNNCPISPATLAVNGTCTVNVSFTPLSTGSRSAVLNVNDNGYVSPQTATVSGSGAALVTQPWPNGYGYQATFTVASGKAPSTQANFPALISGTFADFRTIANGGLISNSCNQVVGNNSTTVPCDLIFTADSGGTTLLNWEFESYNAGTGAMNIWVNVPALGTGTVVYAWYGNASVATLKTTPAGTWNSTFEAVYHLKELPNGAAPQLNDSTGNANNATTNGGMPASQQVPAEIGGGLNFGGGSYYATMANAANFSFERTDSFSVSCWVKPMVNGGSILFSKESSSTPVAGWLLQQFTGSANPTFGFDLANNGNSNRAQAKTAAEFNATAWHHVVATYNGSSNVTGMNIYVDGANQALTTLTNNLTGSIVNSVTPQMNGRSGGNSLSSAVLDECRITAKGVVLSPDWVTTSYNNQSNPTAFFATVTGLTNSGGGGAPAVGLSSGSLTFAGQTTNTTSTAQSVTVTNNGPGPLTIGSIGVSGTNAGDFAQTNNCPLSPATLAVGGFCTINVTFTPTAAGTRSAFFTITDNGNGSPQAVTLSGTGIAPVPVVGLSAASLTFGSQTTNTTSTAQSVTVTNNGPGTLTISSIGVSGTNAGDFAQTNNCPLSPASLAVNGTCSINVTFKPTAAGTRSASLTISDNGSGSPQAAALSGTGVSAVWPNGYSYQATFTVAGGKVPSAQSNFPVLVSGTFADLKTLANGGRISNTCSQVVGNNSSTVPCDLIFTSDSAGSSLLSWEFEGYNAGTGAVNIWVNAPSLSSGTVIYAWYGNPSVTNLQTQPGATWNSNFEAVYHLKELPNGAAPQMNDSTPHANNGTTNGGMPAAQQVAGEIGGALNFGGGNYYATLANAANFSFERTDSFSVSCWVQPAVNGGGILLSKETSTAPVAGWVLQQFAGSANPTFGFDLANNGNSNRAQAKTTAEFSATAWHYVVATYSGSSSVTGMSIYVDGANQALTTLTNNLTGSIVNSATPQMNGRSGVNALSSAVVDECRISAKGVVLSPDWVTASYNNQSNPGTFFTTVTGIVP